MIRCTSVKQESVFILLSPFWENVNEQCVGGTLLLLSGLMICSSALTIARYKSWGMYLSSVALLFLAGMMTVPFADSQSPRQFQHWLMLAPTLATLSVLQILWIGITVFAPIKDELKMELADKKQDAGHSIQFSPILLLTRWLPKLLSVLPSPVLLLFLFWLEQNILVSTTEIRPSTAGIQVAGGISAVLTMCVLAAILFFSKHQLIGLHLLVGCLLMFTCVLLPCLTQSLTRNTETILLKNTNATICLLCGGLVLIITGIILPRKKISKILHRNSNRFNKVPITNINTTQK